VTGTGVGDLLFFSMKPPTARPVEPGGLADLSGVL